ncbi:MAG: efflux RND transporter periplasmic adaptor subunit [Pseudomonadales bacterium]|nr:efflux RND transporter periplasmic adaptor subunit [Pseudomonadales bacterium]
MQDKQQRKMVPLRMVLMPVAIVLASIVVFIIFAAFAPKPEKLVLEVKVPLVETLELKAATVSFTVFSQGTVAPRTETTLVSEVAGQVKKVSDKFFAGGYFKKGELILEIDPISYEVALLQAQARLDGAHARWVEENAKSKQAEHEWRMTGKALSEAPVLALRKPMLQQAKADIKAAEADVKNAKIKLARTRITAPYDAMIKQKIADIGQYVSTGSQLAVTFAVDYAEVRLPVKARELPYVNVPAYGATKADKNASSVELTTTLDKQDYIWKTAISRSEGVVDSRSRVNYLIVEIADPYNLQHQSDRPQLQIGAFVNAKISAVSIDNIYTIPRAALRGDSHIFLVDEEHQLNIVEINIFHSDKQNIYIRDALSDGRNLVLTNLHTPVQGMNLRLMSSGDESETSQLESLNEE